MPVHKQIIKKKGIPFTQIANSMLDDKEISLKAKGLFAFMYSKPETWNFTLSSMSKQLKEGTESIRSAITELKEYGYIDYAKHYDGTGIYTLSYDPNAGNPNMGITTMVKPDCINKKDLPNKKDCISSKVVTLTKVELMEGWNKYAKDIGIASVYEITDERYRKFTTRCNRYTDFVDRLIECLVIASGNKYLKESSWFTLDWIIANDTNHIKVLEGKYK